MGKKSRRKTTSNGATLTDVAPPTDTQYSNDALVDDLLAELDARDAESSRPPSEKLESISSSPLEDTKTRRDSQARFKAREMRRMANRLAKLPTYDEANADKIAEETVAEEKTIRTLCDQRGLRIQEINPDGHCLFAAIADQLALLSILPPAQATYYTTRKSAADYIQSHPDDFLPFLVSTSDNNSGEPMAIDEFQKYCDTMRSTAAWGGEPEIQALSRAYNVPIHVIQGDKPFEVVHRPSNSDENLSGPAVRISYHRHMYGLGEHYNSLRPSKLPS